MSFRIGIYFYENIFPIKLELVETNSWSYYERMQIRI